MTSSTSFGPKRRPRAKISLTPLIDVVFILLVFFMLASNFLDWREVRLSAAGPAGSSASVEGAMLLDVTPGGLRISGVAVSEEELEARVSERLRSKPDQRFLLRPAPGVDMQRLARVLDRLGAAGARDVALMPGAAP